MLIAVEDSLGEAVARKLLAVACPRIHIAQSLPPRGNAYLKEKAENLNRAARGFPVFLLTDLDDPRQCPAGLIQSWLRTPRHPSFFFRVAVMEVESWLMADRNAFARFLMVPVEKIPLEIDRVVDAKRLLVSLARLSRSSRIRADLVPASGSTSRVGPLYNPTLSEFVSEIWTPERAEENSPSLRRAFERLRELGSRA